jgi:hypothetical protein
MDDLTPHDNFLYLMSELEQAIERRTIVWSIESSREAQRRLYKLAATIHRMTLAKGDGDS